MADDRNANVVLTADVSNYSQQMTAAQTSTNQAVDSVMKLLDALDRLSKNTGRKLELISATTLAGIAAATVAAGRLEAQMSTLQATAAITGRSINTANSAVDNLRRSLPVSTDQVVGLVTALGKMGSTTQNVEKLAATFIKLGAATGEDIGTLAQGMIGLQRAMGTTEGSTTKFANSVAGLSANLGVSASGILQFSQSLAPIARTVGMTQTEVMGLSAAFLKSGQDGYAAANATVKMITDISRATRYGSADLSMYANLVGKTTEEFAKMGSTDQLQALFGAINKAGPDAIKILERMGLDGPRALKAIQGLAQSGNLQASLTEATRAFNGDDLERGSKAAMDGFNDSLTRLRNNLTSIAQDFGKLFLPALTAVTESFEGLTSAIRNALGPISGILGALGAAGAAGTGIAGFAVSNIGALAAAATGLMLLRSSLGAGMAARRQADTGVAPRSGIYQRSIPTLMAGGGSRFQQWMFGAGQRLEGARAGAGGFLGGVRTGLFGNRAAGQGNVLQRGAMLASLGLQGFMNIARSSVDPLTANQRENLVNRSQNPLAGMRDQWRAVRTGEDASFRRAMTGAGSSIATFARSLMGATAGITQMGAAAARTALISSAGAAARGVGRGAAAATAGGLSALGRMGGGLLGAMGGPLGLALMGGLAIGGGVMQARGESQAQRELLSDNTGANSAVNKYASSLGLAGSAAMSFADTLRKAEKQIEVEDEERARRVTSADVTAASVPGRELSDPALAGMTRSRAAAYAGSIMGGQNIDPNIIQAFKLDLIQAFDPETAQNIMRQGGSANYRPGAIVAPERGEGVLGFFRSMFQASDEFTQSISAATDATKVQAAEIYSRYGEQESTEYRSVAVNQLLSRFSTAPSRAGGHALAQGIESILGGNLDLTADDLELLHGAGSNRERISRFRGLVAGTDTGDAFLEASSGSAFATRYLPPATENIDPTERRIRGTAAGSLARADSRIARAISQPADANLNLQAARQWADQLVNMTGTTSGAIEELQRLREAANDAESDISLMADSAIQAAQRIQQREMAFASPGQRGQMLMNNVNAAFNIGGPDQQQRIIAAEDAVTNEEIAQGERYRGVIRAFREFDISTRRQTEDFNKQRSRADYQFNLQRQRSQEDYNLSRARSNEDYFTQLERGQYNYDLQRQQSQDDYDKSRRRAEADYQHQIVMMSRQTAQSITDVYTRITTQPTWDARNLLGNAQDQLSRMRQQQSDLSTIRGMGVSGDVIEMMGLNDFQNQQQLARFVADLAADPSLVEAFNQNIAGKLDMGQAFAMDEDSDAWKEMQRSYSLSMERTAEDYETMQRRSSDAYQRSIDLMATDYAKTVSRGADDYSKMLERQNADYALSVEQTVTDWSTQMERARTDLNRSFEEITGTFDELQEAALGQLSGAAQEQMNDMATKLAEARKKIVEEAELAKSDVTTSLAPLFGSSAAAQAALNAAVMINGGNVWGGASGSFGGPNLPTLSRADGGHIPGYSPHPRADNIPAMLTAGEYVQPVDTTEYYGLDVMEAMRSKKIPKWAVQGFAEGGLVEFGRLLQDKGFRVGEHPLFGGVRAAHMKGSLHYRGQAIDVNYGPGGTSLVEQKAIDTIVGLAKNYGLSTIWRAPGHFDHAHFDTGNYSKIGSSTVIGNNPSVASAPSVDIGGIMRNRHIKEIESQLSNMPTAGLYSPGRFTAALGTMLSKVGRVEPDAKSWFAHGGLFSGAQTIGVGERGPEAVLPLNARGADFLAETMNRFNPQGMDRVRGGQVVETKTITYQQAFDQSTNINGRITVVAQDPNEMARRLEEKARMDRLRRPR